MNLLSNQEHYSPPRRARGKLSSDTTLFCALAWSTARAVTMLGKRAVPGQQNCVSPRRAHAKKASIILQSASPCARPGPISIVVHSASPTHRYRMRPEYNSAVPHSLERLPTGGPGEYHRSYLRVCPRCRRQEGGVVASGCACWCGE